MPNKTSSLTYRWMEQVWNSNGEDAIDAIDQMLDANAEVHGIEGIDQRGPQGFKNFYRSFKEQFPHVHVEVDEVISEGEYETSRCTVDGRTASGQDVHFTGMTCVRISNGKIIEAWNSFDFKTMYEQLGFRMAPAAEITA